jgi:molybdate transport system substrate-binding protein
MSMRKHLSSAIFVTALVFGSLVSARAQGEITLLAPRPAKATIDKVVAGFEAKSSYKVKVTYLGYVPTRTSVAQGKGLDVDLLPAPYPGAVGSGTINPGSAVTVATALTALAVPKGRPRPDISTPAAVKKALLDAKSIGYEDPDFTVAGQGAWEPIDKLGIADQVAAKSKVMLGPGGQGIPPAATEGANSTYTHLEKGEIDIALMLLSDILENKDKYEIVGVLPKQISTPIKLTGFISTKASNPEAAKALLQYMTSPEAQAIFKEGGFGPRS